MVILDLELLVRAILFMSRVAFMISSTIDFYLSIFWVALHGMALHLNIILFLLSSYYSPILLYSSYSYFTGFTLHSIPFHSILALNISFGQFIQLLV